MHAATWPALPPVCPPLHRHCCSTAGTPAPCPPARAGVISAVIPWSTEPKSSGLAVNTVVLFNGGCEAGKAAARMLHVKLLGDVRPLFYVPAPHAKSLFGDVYMVTVSHPYLVWQCCWAVHLVRASRAWTPYLWAAAKTQPSAASDRKDNCPHEA